MHQSIHKGLSYKSIVERCNTTLLIWFDKQFYCSTLFTLGKPIKLSLVSCIQGPPGSVGRNGLIGIPGIAGKNGSKGEKGAKGEEGQKGENGTKGAEVQLTGYFILLSYIDQLALNLFRDLKEALDYQVFLVKLVTQVQLVQKVLRYIITICTFSIPQRFSYNYMYHIMHYYTNNLLAIVR